MTQNLLDTTALLLNSTKAELNLGTGTKNYTETFSNGKSFNDILSTANNNLMKDNKYNTNNLSKNNKFNNNNNNNSSNNNNNNNDNISSKTLNDTKNRKTDNSVANSNKSTQNTQKTQNSQTSQSTQKTQNVSEKTQNSSDNTNVSTAETNDVSTETGLSEEISINTDVIDNSLLELDSNISISNINVDSDVFSETDDLQNLEQLLLIDEVDESSTPADFYINAYYQSTIDSLQQVESTDLEQDTLLSQDSILQTTQANLTDDLVSDVTADLSVENDALLSTNDIQKTDNLNTVNQAVDTTKDTEQDLTVDRTKLKSEALESKDVNKESDLADNQKEKITVQNKDAVEVDTFTNEDNTVNNDVLVNVSDDVMQEAPVAASNQNETKLSFREVMEKAGLDEAKLEALNLNVTNVSSGESDLSGNLGQGSAQEDVARISFETQTKSNETQNKDFSKFIDKKQSVEEQPKEISKNDILSQINNKMQAQNINGTKKITLQLTPESLGKITIEIMKGKDGLQAKMLTDNFQVKEMLERNIDGLKATLSNQGVTVNNVSVKVASASESSSEFLFGRDNFNEENSQQQDFAGTGDRRGENESHFEKNVNPEIADEENDENISTEELISENEEIISEGESEKIAVGAGNVDIEV